jgi:hypothetical protein
LQHTHVAAALLRKWGERRVAFRRCHFHLAGVSTLSMHAIVGEAERCWAGWSALKKLTRLDCAKFYMIGMLLATSREFGK